MKFDPGIKYNQLSESYREDLSFLDVKNLRVSIWVFILLLYDLGLTMGISFIGKIEFVWMIVPMAVVIHVWGIRLSFKNVYSTQVESILFMAIFSYLATLSFLIVIIGLSIYTLSMTSIYYYLILLLIIIISSYPIMKSQMDKRLRDPFEHQEKKGSRYESLMYAAPGLGVLLTGLVSGNIAFENIYTTILMFLMYLVFLYMAAKFIYKYKLIKANIHLVKFRKPSKKEQYKLQEKGVEIK